jgi:ATP-dependent RNA helicase DeaD
MKFNEMGLSPDTMKSLEVLGFETPTPIQEQAIPILLKGERDFVGLASTGTGKTAAFGLPLLERVDPAIGVPQGIILCPTRELCL